MKREHKTLVLGFLIATLVWLSTNTMHDYLKNRPEPPAPPVPTVKFHDSLIVITIGDEIYYASSSNVNSWRDKKGNHLGWNQVFGMDSSELNQIYNEWFAKQLAQKIQGLDSFGDITHE